MSAFESQARRVAMSEIDLAFYVHVVPDIVSRRLRVFGGTPERQFVLSGAEYREIWPWVDNLWHRTSAKPEMFECDNFHVTGIRQRHTNYICNQARSKRKSEGSGSRAKTWKVKNGCNVKLEVVEKFVMTRMNGILEEVVIAAQFTHGPDAHTHTIEVGDRNGRSSGMNHAFEEYCRYYDFEIGRVRKEMLRDELSDRMLEPYGYHCKFSRDDIRNRCEKLLRSKTRPENRRASQD